MKLCPKCEAEQALRLMRQLEALPATPDVNWYAHAAGIAEGTLTRLVAFQLRVCSKHRSHRRNEE